MSYRPLHLILICRTLSLLASHYHPGSQPHCVYPLTWISVLFTLWDSWPVIQQTPFKNLARSLTLLHFLPWLKWACSWGYESLSASHREVHIPLITRQMLGWVPSVLPMVASKWFLLLPPSKTSLLLKFVFQTMACTVLLQSCLQPPYHLGPLHPTDHLPLHTVSSWRFQNPFTEQPQTLRLSVLWLSHFQGSSPVMARLLNLDFSRAVCRQALVSFHLTYCSTARSRWLFSFSLKLPLVLALS